MTAFLLASLIAVIAMAFGFATRWDSAPASRQNPLDPDEIWRRIVGEEPLPADEKRWLDELSALELTARHRIC